MKKIMDRNAGMVSRAVENMIKTGKLASSSGLDLPQVLNVKFEILIYFLC